MPAIIPRTTLIAAQPAVRECSDPVMKTLSLMQHQWALARFRNPAQACDISLQRGRRRSVAIRIMPVLLCLLAIALPAPAHAATVVVSDYLPINVRKGPGPRDSIIAAVKSGDRLEVLGRQPGYLKVRTPKGNVGWVLARFVQDEPVARDRLAAAEQQRDAAEVALAAVQEEAATLRQRNTELSEAQDMLQARVAELESELERISEAAGSTLEIQSRNDALKQKVRKMEEQSAALRLEIDAQDVRRSSLILGAGILVVGLLLGLILPLLRPRRSGWSDY